MPRQRALLTLGGILGRWFSLKPADGFKVMGQLLRKRDIREANGDQLLVPLRMTLGSIAKTLVEGIAGALPEGGMQVTLVLEIQVNQRPRQTGPLGHPIDGHVIPAFFERKFLSGLHYLGTPAFFIFASAVGSGLHD